jgi:hypothetical protein
MKALLAALCALSSVSLAHARPVVIEESAILSAPDSSWTYFGGSGVAIDGDYALIFAGRRVPDPSSETGQSLQGAALLYRRTGTTWNYVSQLGPAEIVSDVQTPGLAMKEGIAVTVIGRPRVFERSGTTWTEGSFYTEYLSAQGREIKIDSGRILIPRFDCDRISAVLHKVNGVWSVEGELDGNYDWNCTDQPFASRQDLQGERAVIDNPFDPYDSPVSIARQYARNENGVGWREFGSVTYGVPESIYNHLDVALSGRYLATTGRRGYGTNIYYETQPLIYEKARYGLQTPDAYLDPAILSTSSLERVGPGLLAQIGRGVDPDTHVINVFRMNDDVAHTASQVATLQTRNGTRLGSSFEGSGNRIIVDTVPAWQGGDYKVRIFDLPANLETPEVQVHDFESPSAGAAWQPDAGDSFSTVVARTTHVYRQASTAGNRSAWLPSSTATNQAIQSEIIVRSLGAGSTTPWVGLTTRRIGNNFYFARMLSNGGVELGRRLNGVTTVLASAPPVTFTVGRKYRLRLESLGSTHRVYVDDILWTRVIDDTIAEGNAGVMMSNAAADYDNVIVTPSPFLTIYKHYFNRDYLPTATISDWSFSRGEWQTVDGVLHQSNIGDYGRGVVGARTEDQVVQARIKPLSFAGPDNWVGLMARYQDDRNHLYVSLRSRGVISLWRRTNGAITQLATAKMPVSTGTWYRVRMEVVKGLTRVFVDNQLMLSTNADPGPANPEVLESKGQVGLITYKAKADFDDFLAYQP